jgi:hypothetical protein
LYKATKLASGDEFLMNTPPISENSVKAKFAEFPFHALELIEDKTTVLLPNYKFGRTKVTHCVRREQWPKG